MPNLAREVSDIFDQDTNTFSYVVSDPTNKFCAIIDSVWNFDYASGVLTTCSADRIVKHIESNNLYVKRIIETHVHADHISAATYLKKP